MSLSKNAVPADDAEPPAGVNTAPQTVLAVHTEVPGRGRYFVPELVKNSAAKKGIESLLARSSAIHKVSANPITGTVLVHFPETLTHDEVRRALANLVPVLAPPSSAILPAVVNFPPIHRRAETTPWHALDVEHVIAHFETPIRKGLPKRVAKERLKRFGQNKLETAPRRTRLERFSAQFRTLPVALLSGSAALSLVTGGATEAVVILSVVVANAYIGYGTESLVEVTLSLLSQMGPTEVIVIRQGKTTPIAAEEVVPGDLVPLVPGLSVPADCRIVHSENLFVDESALTGESLPVHKQSAALTEESIPLADRTNMIYRGTIVTGGHGLALVVATGSQTEIGKIQSLVAETKPSETPLQKQMDQLSTQLVSISGLVAGGVFGVGLLRGYGFLEMLQTSVSLAIAAVPEGLPTVATTTLAQTALRMKSHNVLVRNLHAIETLGACEILCLDKTGTLTMNRMRAVTVCTPGQRYDADELPSGNVDLHRVFRVSALCNQAEIIGHQPGKHRFKGSATESALMDLAQDAGEDVANLREQYRVIDTDHRTEDRNYLVTYHRRAEARPDFIAVKGNPTEVLALCQTYLRDGEVTRLTPKIRRAILLENEQMGDRSLRVLGFAEGEGDETTVGKRKLTWLGLVGMADTIRPGISQTIAQIHRAGIQTTMITGDQETTASAVARSLNLAGAAPLRVIDSIELDAMSPRKLRHDAADAHVFARVSPSDKLKIVKALRESGKIVAMAGDGINDAPALKAAHLGIAMGERGTEVAREVADVVLTDDNLSSLIPAVALGRATHDAIKKSVVFLLSTNLSESLLVLGSVTSGLGHAISPLQLLWINLVADVFPAFALALEAPETDVLNRPPRDPKEPIITRADFKRIGIESGIMTVGALGTYGYGVMKYGGGPRAQTLAFTQLALSQLLHTISCRSQTSSVFDRRGLTPNRFIPLAIGAGIGLQGLSLFSPRLRKMLGLTSLGPSDLLLCGGVAMLNFLVNEGIKVARNRPGMELRIVPTESVSVGV